MNKLFLLVVALLLLSCTTEPSLEDLMSQVVIDESQMAKYLETLASDEFEGRMPFTKGEEMSINYIKEELEKMGVGPGNNGSYFQNVPIVEITPVPSESMMISGPAENISLDLKKDYVVYSQREVSEEKAENSEMVFCGFGIVAPEYGWNDFEGLDLKGKTAVVLVNDPGFGSEDENADFKANTMTYYGRWTYKYEEAARQGATGLMIIHETASAGYPWFVVQNGWTGPQMDLQSPDGNMGRAPIQGWFHLDAAKKIFEMAGVDLAVQIRKARTPDFKPIPLGVKMTTSLKSEFKKDNSKNVVGLIKGSTRPDECIIYSAHWDHFGIGAVVDGDSIYNGARDNASGTAAVMAIAKAFSELETPPERSVMFLFVTAEEQGLLGSAYYAANPIFPPENTVANLNIDAMNTFGEMKAIEIIGFGQSELESYAEEEAKLQNRYVVPDQNAEKGLYFRSDHFNFAKVGIPALYFKGGFEHLEKGKEYAKERSDDFTSNRYHRPSDEYRPEWIETSGMRQDAEIMVRIGIRLSFSEEFPRWKEGSEFKAVREKELD